MISVFIYQLGIKVYVLFASIASFFNAKAKLFVQGRKGLLEKIRYSLIDDQRERVWVHCASLGEFEQGRPVIEELRRNHPELAIVITFFSPSGYEVRKKYGGADYVFYLPYDSVSNARKFIELIKPKLAIFVKYEYWYYYLNTLAQKDISTILISAIFRKEQPFFKWYGILHRKMLKLFNHIFVQDEASERLLTKLGVEQVSVAGDTRFDRVVDTVRSVEPIIQLEGFCSGSKILVAGSTWREDEVLLKATIDELPGNCKMILAPHEVHESHIRQLQELYTGSVLWSEYEPEVEGNCRVLIIDRMGLLSGLYQYAYIAYIGGGFNKSGIHNILEAATYGKPLTHGPNYEKFKEARDLYALGGSFITRTKRDLLEKLNQYEKNESSYDSACNIAKEYVEKNVGATYLILNYIQEKLLDTKL